jgi:hypothetical protein
MPLLPGKDTSGETEKGRDLTPEWLQFFGGVVSAGAEITKAAIGAPTTPTAVLGPTAPAPAKSAADSKLPLGLLAAAGGAALVAVLLARR